MKNLSLLMVAAALMSSSLGCMGPRVEIPTAHRGMVLTPSGFLPEVKKPATFRLAYNWWGRNPSELVLVEASDQQKQEVMKLFMPKDRLIMDFDVRGTYSISNADEQVLRIFDRLPPSPNGERSSIIDFDDVYTIYGQQIIWSTSRAILSKYSIDEVVANRKAISMELEVEVRKRLENTPLTVVHFNLSEVQPPELIVNAQKDAKARRVAIKKAREDRAVRIKEAEADYEVALKQQLVDLLDADTSRLVGLELTRGVNPQFLAQRALGVMDQLAKSNDQIIFVPEEALGNQAIMTGVNLKALEHLAPIKRTVVKTTEKTADEVQN